MSVDIGTNIDPCSVDIKGQLIVNGSPIAGGTINSGMNYATVFNADFGVNPTYELLSDFQIEVNKTKISFDENQQVKNDTVKYGFKGSNTLCILKNLEIIIILDTQNFVTKVNNVEFDGTYKLLDFFIQSYNTIYEIDNQNKIINKGIIKNITENSTGSSTNKFNILIKTLLGNDETIKPNNIYNYQSFSPKPTKIIISNKDNIQNAFEW